MTFGVGGGIVLDMLYNSAGLPGYNVKVPNCNTLTVGDAMQLIGLGGFTALGVLLGHYDMIAGSFGALAGGLLPKVIFPAFGLPRYLFFSYNPATGGIAPVGGGLRKVTK